MLAFLCPTLTALCSGASPPLSLIFGSAPWFRSCSMHDLLPCRAAKCSGASPQLFRASAAAPAFSSAGSSPSSAPASCTSRCSTVPPSASATLSFTPPVPCRTARNAPFKASLLHPSMHSSVSTFLSASAGVSGGGGGDGVGVSGSVTLRSSPRVPPPRLPVLALPCPKSLPQPHTVMAKHTAITRANILDES